MRIAFFIAGVTAASLATFAGCSSSTTGTDAGSDATVTPTPDSSTPTPDSSTPDAAVPTDARPDTTTPPVDAGPDTSPPADSGTDAAPPVVNGCTTFEDGVANPASRQLVWDFSIVGTDGRCVKIKVGQDVTWNGDFGTHPLGPQGGTTPSPITNGTGGAHTVTFNSVGTYGYVCTRHSTMNGAILVVP